MQFLPGWLYRGHTTEAITYKLLCAGISVFFFRDCQDCIELTGDEYRGMGPQQSEAHSFLRGARLQQGAPVKGLLRGPLVGEVCGCARQELATPVAMHVFTCSPYHPQHPK